MKENEFLMTVLAAVVLVLAVSGCGPGKNIIGANGIKGVRLGDEMPAYDVEKVAGIPVTGDSIAEEGEFTWRVATLGYKKGPVYLESDFYGAENLNRIRIETPELRLRNGLRVGMTVGDLTQKSSNWIISPLPKYKLFDFYSRRYPGTHFLVHDPGRSMEDPDWESYRPDQFATEAPIVAIVVL
ncbi:MAG: hypothetical protein AAF998_11090 [Bacteroidota bacterium]